MSMAGIVRRSRRKSLPKIFRKRRYVIYAGYIIFKVDLYFLFFRKKVCPSFLKCFVMSYMRVIVLKILVEIFKFYFLIYRF